MVVPAGPPTEQARYEAAHLAREARRQAEIGECDDARALLARIHQLDPATHATTVQDKFVAYCVAP